MPDLRLDRLQSAAQRLRTALGEANNDGSPGLSDDEVKAYRQGDEDRFVLGAALRSFQGWAKGATQRVTEAAVTTVKARIEQAVALATSTNVDGDQVIDAGREYAAAAKRRSFRVLESVAALPAFRSGESFLELRQRVKVTSTRKFTDPSTFPKTLAAPAIAAANEHGLSSSRVEDVFRQVDMNEVVARYFRDPRTERRFIALDFGIGDSTFGAIFDASSKAMVASIEDNEVVPKPGT